jgi:hypothetical protein
MEAPVVEQPATPQAVSAAKAPRKSKVGAYRDQIGVLPDREVATLAGVTVSNVQKYRSRRGIPPIRAPGAALRGMEPTPEPEATAPTQTPSASSVALAAPAKQPRASRLDAFVGQMGVLTDDSVAALAGLSASGVRQYRMRHGIPGAKTVRDAAKRSRTVVEAVPAGEAPAVARVRRGRPSRMAALLDQIGVLTDREVAKLAGVTTQNARVYRERRGIPEQAREVQEVPVPVAPPAPPTEVPREQPQLDTEPPAAVEVVSTQPASIPSGFLVTTDEGEEFVVMAADISAAAARAVARLEVHRPGRRVVSVTYLANVLVR